MGSPDARNVTRTSPALSLLRACTHGATGFWFEQSGSRPVKYVTLPIVAVPEVPSCAVNGDSAWMTRGQHQRFVDPEHGGELSA